MRRIKMKKETLTNKYEIARQKLREMEHRQNHVFLHKALDDLAKDYTICTGKLLSKTSVLELLIWAYEQTLNPSVTDCKEG
jgi:hypothetical protein